MLEKIRLMLARTLLPDGYYVDTLDTFDPSSPMTMHKIALGRSSAFNETMNEMTEQYGLATWGEYMYNWVKAKNDEAKCEIEAYKKSAEMSVGAYRSDME